MNEDFIEVSREEHDQIERANYLAFEARDLVWLGRKIPGATVTISNTENSKGSISYNNRIYNVSSMIDEWFYVYVVINDEFRYYKCDQMSGLVRLLEKIY